MRRDAGAEIEGDAIEVIALARRAGRAALLQAIDARIAKVPAARALGEIAAERGDAPDLRRRQTAGRGGDARIGRGEALVGRDGGDGRQGADSRRAARIPGDPGHLGRWLGCRSAARARRRCGAAPRDRFLRREIRPLSRRRRSSQRWSCGAPPLDKTEQPVGPERDLVRPRADRIADGVGDRG